MLYFLFLFLALLPSLSMPDGKKNKLLYNFFSLGIVQVITSLLQLIVIPYVISKIGVDGFGTVAVAQVVMFYLSAFTEYGFNQTATRDIAIHRNDRLMVSKFFFRIIFSKLILCILSFIILLVLFTVVPLFRLHLLLYQVGFAFVAGQAVLINWFLLGVEKMQLMAVISLIARLIFVISVFLFIKSKGDEVLYLFFLGAGNFVMGLVSIFVVIRKFKLQFILPGLHEILDEFKKGWKIMATNLSNNICQYSNIFILRFFADDLLAGYYSIAERIFFTLRQMLSVFSQTVYPQVCLLVKTDRDPIISYFRKVYVPFFMAIFGGCTLLFILSPEVLYIFIGHENIHAVLLLRVFAVVLVVACLNIPAALLLLATDQRQSYFKVYTAGAVLNIVLNILLAYFFRSTGTVIAILITELFIMAGFTSELLRLNVIKKKSIIQKAGL
jgi:polysaccharide transporter, PST family